MKISGFSDYERPLPEGLREFDDTKATRQSVYDRALSALQKKFPISKNGIRLELHEPRLSGDSDFSLAKQKQALIAGRSLRTPIKGLWKLVDEATGEVLDEREEVVMHVPYYTDRGTIVNNGNDYTIVNQARLKPGVYTRTRRSGEHEAHVNVLPGSGKGFRLWLEPATGIMRVNVGQSNIPVYEFFRTLGISDEDMKKAWGEEVFNANINKKDSNALKKLYDKFGGKFADKAADDVEKIQKIREIVAASKLDENVVARTLGLEKQTHVAPENLLRTTEKLLNVNRGVEEEDDRDAPEFAQIHSVDDFVEERIDKDAGKTLRNLLNKVTRQKNLKAAGRGALTPWMDSFVLNSGMASPSEETNPVSILDQIHRVVKLGEGGLPSEEAVTEEARDVMPGQVGFIDTIAGPESGRIGIDTRLAYRTFKGKDKQIYGEFINPRTGEYEYHRPEDVAKLNVAFPGEQGKKRQYVVSRGRMKRVKEKEVDLVVPSQAHMYNPTINMVSMPTSFQPARAFYAAKYHPQYLPVKDGEAPLVQTEVPGSPGKSFAEYYGRKVATVSSPVEGTVTHVSNKTVTVTDKDGKKHVQELVQDFPFNRLTAISFRPAVKVGTPVGEGDMLATSNFTDDRGRLSYGKNLKTAVVPYRGFTFEDAYIISEDAAKKMTSERMHGYDVSKRNGVKVNRNRFISAFPKKYTKEQVDKIDKDGVIKKGQVVHYGDPLILATGPRTLSAEDASVGNLHKVLRNMHRDDSVIWEHHTPGIVTDVAYTAKGAAVNVKTESPVQVGDKLANAHASKGITGKIIPTEEMPVDSKGEPYDILLNPMVVQSRVAPNQLNDLRLGKVAKATGEPIVIPGERPPEGWTQFTKNMLEKHGISGEETIKDPITGKLLESQGDGYMYFSPFHHLAEKKLSARDTGGYTQDRQPAKGGETGAKRVGGLDVKALLSHGATEVIKDAMVVRGNRNSDFWTALKLGRPLPKPEVPFVYNKFLNLMKAGGVGILEKDQTQKLYSLTDEDINKMSNGEIKSGETVDAATLKTKPGGLFDESLTGGLVGNRWGHITLAQPVPNPIMEDPIRRLLGMTQKQFKSVLTGREEYEGMRGGQSIRDRLATIDLDAEIKKYEDEAKNGRGAKRDNAVKLLGILHNARKMGTTPDKWMLSKIPVLPPVFRPLSSTGDVLLVDDMNDLYKDVLEVNNQIKDLSNDLDQESLADEQKLLYDAVQAVMGWGEPATAENRSKRLKGSVKKIFGTNPKSGFFQSKVISKTVDTVGRGVVAPDPNLDMDTVGIPEEKAWELYKPFVLRKLVRRGFPPVRAKEMIEKQDKEAKAHLIEVMDERPVLINRAPSWHKFNVLAFKPQLVRDPVIRVSPLIVGGFNMDFDGDTATMHVPVSDKAVEEAWTKMRPSRNLFTLMDRRSLQHTPGKEMLMGLYHLTKPAEKGKKPVVFRTLDEAKKAYHQGLIGLNDPVEILDVK